MRRILVAAALLTVQGPPVHLAAQVRTWTATYDTVGTAPRVTSPGYTGWRDSTTGWVLRLERTFPVADPVPVGSSFTSRRTLLFPDGRVAVSSTMPAAVQLYDTSGVLIRSIGSAGNGPGQYLMPTDMVLHHDTLIVLDGRQARLLFYNVDGTYIRTFFTEVYGTGGRNGLAIDPRGLIRLPQGRGAIDGPAQRRWVYFDMNGKLRDSLDRPPMQELKGWTIEMGPGRINTFGVPFQPLDADGFLNDGSLIYGRGDRMQLLVSRRGADTALIMERTGIQADSIPKWYADSTVAQMTRSQPLLAGRITSDALPTFYPLWNEFAIDGRGYIWVSMGSWALRTHYFAIFAPDGRYLGHVISRFESLIGTSWQADHVAVPTWDQNRTPTVRIYRIDRKESR